MNITFYFSTSFLSDSYYDIYSINNFIYFIIDNGAQLLPNIFKSMQTNFYLVYFRFPLFTKNTEKSGLSK